MTLSTHVIVGAAAATPFLTDENYFVGALAAVLSHYVIDMIPHWSVGHHLHSIARSPDQEKRGVRNRAALARDVMLVLLDLAIGVLALIAILGIPTNAHATSALLIIVVGSCLPDGLQFIQLWYKKTPVRELQTLHDWFHFKTPGHADLAPTFTTLGSQVALIVCASFFL